MKAREIASRYAKAFFELTEIKVNSEAVHEALVSIINAMAAQPKLLALFQNPLISRSEKYSVVDKMIPGKDQVLPKQFLNLLLTKNRIYLLPEIVNAFGALLDNKKGLAKANVVTARPLAEDLIETLKKTVEKISKKTVVFNLMVDPDLIGGIQIHMQNRLIDGSIKSKLSELHYQLKTVKVS